MYIKKHCVQNVCVQQSEKYRIITVNFIVHNIVWPWFFKFYLARTGSLDASILFYRLIHDIYNARFWVVDAPTELNVAFIADTHLSK